MTDPRRRRLLTALVAATAGLAGAGAWRLLDRRGSAPVAGNGNARPTVTGDAGGATTPGLMATLRTDAPLQLEAAAVKLDLFGGATTTIWAYRTRDASGRTVLNPTLLATRGGTVDVTLDNVLAEDTTIHWHGLSLDEANDGSGLHPVAAGTRRRYRFAVPNRAGLYWYHAHPHLRTGRQLQMGLAGLLVVEDEEERALRAHLDLPWGDRDRILMLTDKQVGADNAIAYRDGADDWIGNRMLVNWSPEPILDVAPATHRFRMINVANARVLRPAFLHEGRPLPMRLLGTDGGLLDRPQTLDDLFLAPAQRADVLVDFSSLPPGAAVVLHSLAYTPMENEDETGPLAPAMMAEHPGAAMMGEAIDLALLRIAGAASPPVEPPERLSALPALADTRDWTLRPIRLTTDADGNWLINGMNFHTHGHAPAFAVKRGAREVWEIRNNISSMPHPIHLHGVQFRVVSRSISPMDIRARALGADGCGPQDLGLLDTVLVWPGEIVRIAIDFAQPYTGTQRYMLHCHNLEHEDMGMMLTFAVTDDGGNVAARDDDEMSMVSHDRADCATPRADATVHGTTPHDSTPHDTRPRSAASSPSSPPSTAPRHPVMPLPATPRRAAP